MAVDDSASRIANMEPAEMPAEVAERISDDPDLHGYLCVVLVKPPNEWQISMFVRPGLSLEEHDRFTAWARSQFTTLMETRDLTYDDWYRHPNGTWTKWGRVTLLPEP